MIQRSIPAEDGKNDHQDDENDHEDSENDNRGEPMRAELDNNGDDRDTCETGHGLILAAA